MKPYELHIDRGYTESSIYEITKNTFFLWMKLSHKKNNSLDYVWWKKYLGYDYSICYVIKVFLTQKNMVSLGGIKWEHGNIGEKWVTLQIYLQ